MIRELWFGQSFVIGSVGMFYSGNRRFFEISEIMRNTPITLVRRSGSLKSVSKLDRMFCDMDRTAAGKEQLWREWAEEEAKRRLGFAVFVSPQEPRDRTCLTLMYAALQLIDSHISLCFNLTPCMSVSELRQSLPACERIWNAATPEEWLEACTFSNNSPCKSRPAIGCNLR